MPDGTTLRQNMENAKRQSKMIAIDTPELVELPDSMREYWSWFLRLNSKRQPGFGMAPITYTEIESFFSLYGIIAEPYEVEVIEMFDRVAMEYSQAQQAKADQKAKSKAKKK